MKWWCVCVCGLLERGGGNSSAYQQERSSRRQQEQGRAIPSGGSSSGSDSKRANMSYHYLFKNIVIGDSGAFLSCSSMRLNGGSIAKREGG